MRINVFHFTTKLSLLNIKERLKQLIRRLLGDTALGAIDYYRNPQRGVGWGGPFNGQHGRQRLFKEMVAAVNPQALIETGTYLGATTEFFAEFGKPVFTVEGHLRTYGFSRARLRGRPNVTLVHGDSRVALRQWCEGPLGSFAEATLVFYLDAHWNGDLPLANELDIVFSRCPMAVAMIDDFQVPFDDGYGYDDYGPGKALIVNYIAPLVAKHELQIFYPATPSGAESGMRRGCVVLARDHVHTMALGSLPLLRAAGKPEVALAPRS
ncbi:MAG TPA: hypothetical protein VHW66_13805 [Stellaceae bacterium]|jgi:hypothetical protein|nr:hypothetical protein [Stellaceae bacterium]